MPKQTCSIDSEPDLFTVSLSGLTNKSRGMKPLKANAIIFLPDDPEPMKWGDIQRARVMLYVVLFVLPESKQGLLKQG
jgi:hypothetical protein